MRKLLKNVQIYPERQSLQMNRGSLLAVKTVPIVGRLKNERGELLTNRYISSNVSTP